MKYLIILYLYAFISCTATSQPLQQKKSFTRQDSLRGTITPERAWWDVQLYNLLVVPDFEKKSIRGVSEIYFTVTELPKNKIMQIDLQEPLNVDMVRFNENVITNFRREGNVFFVDLNDQQLEEKYKYSLRVSYSGVPRPALNPPWDGGWIWKLDAKNRPWMSVACQGLGASVWYPCKDHQSDEPDMGATISVITPDSLTTVANGNLMQDSLFDNKRIMRWRVTNPINNYNLIPYIGKYEKFSETYNGVKGNLKLDYWVLDYNVEKAKNHLPGDTKAMLASFENWFGQYPFYDDGFKLVESPHLGMEHQSAIAYGNKFMKGYLGKDLSGTGWGTKWDFIIIHEAGHEWFGNNITTKDIADMWVHEGFTNYSETLFTETLYGKKAGSEYVQGIRKNIANDKPIIGHYGVNQEGSGDMYAKASNMIHTIRQVINNDDLFKEILRGLNRDFFHKTVTGAEVENYISSKSKINFQKIFDQYLRTTQIPNLEWKIENNSLQYRWTNVVEGFDLPVKVQDQNTWLQPTTKWKKQSFSAGTSELKIEPDFYITVSKAK